MTKIIINKTLKILIPLSLFTLIVYLLTSPGNTAYNYFTHLADAFIHGRYYLTEQIPWFTELIPDAPNRFFVVYPPMPAILSIPFVAIFGVDFPQQYLTHVLGIGIAIVSFLLSLHYKKDTKQAIWVYLTIAIGSIIWFLSSQGSAWYLGQITSAFFLIAAIYESLTKKRLWLISIFLGAVYLSRVHVVLSAPFFLYVLKDNLKSVRSWAQLIIPGSIFVFFDWVYNYVRYGSILNKGYFLIPGTMDEPWFSKGIMHPSYIIEDLKVAFLAGPLILKEFPYIQPSWAGMALWLTTPALLLAIFAPFKKPIVKFAWLSIFLIFLVVGMHGGTGFTQFGYRFAVDFYPFLILLMIMTVSKTGLKKYHWVLLIWSIVVNLWGVLWINKFGWVSY